ncbi:MAG: ribonuclease HII [Erysipelotrichaceae bacterium]|nr:ribonuclease HII [Erysipelotrichaceae bacterium]
MSLLNEFENKLWPEDKLVMGIDEAGRGPLCGPLVVASCIFPVGYDNELINDSKKLSEKKREKLYDIIVNDALFFSIKVVTPKEIDEYNIYGATQRAMRELSYEYDVETVLTDAMPIEDNPKVVPMIKGDAKSISIAGASILAKVTRDRLMYELDALYPEYEYKKHKGYPTKRHLELMEEYGVFDIYRFSFRPCQDKKIREDIKFYEK